MLADLRIILPVSRLARRRLIRGGGGPASLPRRGQRILDMATSLHDGCCKDTTRLSLWRPDLRQLNGNIMKLFRRLVSAGEEGIVGSLAEAGKMK